MEYFQRIICIFLTVTTLHSQDFGSNVYIFNPSMSAERIQATCDSIFEQQETAQFGKGRFALLFKPGEYKVDINVGYYTHVAGLGLLPGDAVIKGAVRAEGDWARGNVTQNFWRACENLEVIPAENSTNRWAVSQAAPFRRMHIKGNLVLHDGGWASGGFIADSKIDGLIISGSQQQWYSRNSVFGQWQGRNWNMVFQGIVNAPAGSFEDSSYTILDTTPVMREKPFLTLDNNGEYYVFVPPLKKESKGISWADGNPAGEKISLAQFYIVKEGSDAAESINRALQENKHLLFTPGIYYLSQGIKVRNPNTIVMGLGIATLIPENGSPAMEISDVGGVQIAGLLFDAAETESAILLRVGEEKNTKDHADNPVSLHDVFCRVGGMTAGRAENSVTINSNNVIGDHFWIWRADHGHGVGWDINRAKTGLIVNGDNVTICGLFVEHYQEYQTLWNGNGGKCFFYQCELPYDPPDQVSWQHDGIAGWPGYKVASFVKTHQAWGLGVYAFLRNQGVDCFNAIEVPVTDGVKMKHMVTISYSRGGGEITRIINGAGEPANKENPRSRLAGYP